MYKGPTVLTMWSQLREENLDLFGPYAHGDDNGRHQTVNL